MERAIIGRETEKNELKKYISVNNIGKVYRHNNRVVYHLIVIYMEVCYHTYL